MRRMRPALRLAIRIKQRSYVRSGQHGLARILNKALVDPDVQDVVIQQATANRSIGDGGFLQFFLENWEQILEIILTIIGLFGSQEDRDDIVSLHTVPPAVIAFWDASEVPVS